MLKWFEVLNDTDTSPRRHKLTRAAGWRRPPNFKTWFSDPDTNKVISAKAMRAKWMDFQKRPQWVWVLLGPLLRTGSTHRGKPMRYDCRDMHNIWLKVLLPSEHVEICSWMLICRDFLLVAKILSGYVQKLCQSVFFLFFSQVREKVRWDRDRAGKGMDV